MKNRSLLLMLALLVSVSDASAKTIRLFQPEKEKANGDVIRNEEDTAWDGEYASTRKDYNPLFIGETAGISGDTIFVWARLRGYAVQVKSVQPDDKQVELDWNWEKPKDWKWIKLGTYTPEKLGKAVIIIRGPDAAENAGLDAVLFTTDPSVNPTEQTEAEVVAKIKAEADSAGTGK